MKIPIIYWPLEFTLKVCSFWPGQSSIFGPLLVASAPVTLIPFQCWDAALIIDSPLILMDSLSDIITEFLLYTKLFVMWSKRRYIIDILKEISSDYEGNALSEKWPKLHSNAHKFCKYDYGWYIGASLVYYFQLIFVYITAPVEYRLMLLKAYYPFNYKMSPYFELLNLTQFVQGFAMASVNAMSETLLVTLVLYVGGHVEALRDQINNFTIACAKDTRDNINYHHLINNVLKQHLKVLNLVKNVETFYTYVSLAQLFFSSLTICVSGFVIILVQWIYSRLCTLGVKALQQKDVVILVKFVLFMMILLWQAFSFCYVGQYLLDKNEEVTAALYDTYWYNVESKEVKSLVFILKKMQNPLELTAGKFVRLSTQSFCAIIKSSFSYLSVLRAAYV